MATLRKFNRLVVYEINYYCDIALGGITHFISFKFLA